MARCKLLGSPGAAYRLCVLLLVGVAACQGESSQGETEGREFSEVRLGYLRIGSDLPYYVGQHYGIFASHGLVVTPVRLATSNLAGDALAQGAVDATDIIGSSVVFQKALESPGSLRVFMASQADSTSNIHQLIAVQGSGIQTMRDLVGRRLAVFPGSQMRAYVKMVLAAYLSPEELASVELVPLSPPQQRGAVENGQVDAVLTLEPTGTQLVAAGLGQRIGSNVLYESISRPAPFITAFGVMRTEWIERDSTAAARLLEAYQEIAEFIRTYPDSARLVLVDSLGLSPEVAGGVSLYDYIVSPALSADAIEATAQIMVSQGVLRMIPDVESLVLKEDGGGG